ncbi:ADP-ribosylglycohydrolase family protein [Talaromyces proteolyticus]|uniref:ADP-ribosylhydrolase ARH3 n=1 Tax=Talaromyces proteolyticus TaxID=1131652 RepID=A0AAD4L495_9EURO|nr:ADP-ribosylglycohydrolase family protein [Talaromyces proteolyticus]KAH8705623.1 ADP-ribosylglycohydrolase family protein [Talaromyces proteolyticus]
MPTLSSRALGTINGACVGDALGGPVQFMRPGSFAPITGLEYVKPFRQPAGSYSDDGAMTLALAQSFIDANGKYNHLGSIKYYLEWLFDGRFSTRNHAWDVGVSTRLTLSIWRDAIWKYYEWKSPLTDDDITETQNNVSNSLGMEESSGNGSLMRIAVVGVMMHTVDDIDIVRETARKQSSVTHPSIACQEACAVYTEVVWRAMHGEPKDQLAHAISVFPVSHTILRQRLAAYPSLSSWQETSNTDIKSSGWVIDTLEVALWAFFKFDNWKDGALAVVNLGGDADTAGAVYGALAGCWYGVEGIPGEWKEGMRRKELIEEIAEGVSGLV